MVMSSTLSVSRFTHVSGDGGAKLRFSKACNWHALWCVMPSSSAQGCQYPTAGGDPSDGLGSVVELSVLVMFYRSVVP